LLSLASFTVPAICFASLTSAITAKPEPTVGAAPTPKSSTGLEGVAYLI
jgi:hypothetical protein